MTKRKQTPDVLAEILGGEPVGSGAPVLEGSEPVQPFAVRPVPPAPQWEYALVSFQDHKGWRPRFLNGRELKDWSAGPSIHDYLQAMADDGWELAAASAGERLYGSSDTHQLFFKRRRT